jgi:peptidoglycan/LPS O-acetylase OafA/YrhL
MTRTHLPQPDHIRGLDAIRFLCALTVLLGHFGLPLPETLGEHATGLAKVARGIVSCLFNGPAAVIVFFVISGFCIHFPQRSSLRLDAPSYFCRRLVRIGLPALLAVLLSVQMGEVPQPPYFSIFWSIICELIYYLMYPLLLSLRRSFGWPVLLAVASLLSVGLWVTHVSEMREAQQSYLAFGHLTWLNGLPCWLLGCWLAENHITSPVVSKTPVWCWRFGIIGLSVALRIAKFHVPSLLASNCITLNLFAFAVFFWLRAEIDHHRTHAPSPLLEWCGRWSYSLYLTHALAPIWVAMLLGASSTSKVVLWCSWIAVSLLFAWLFYRLVEAPSQKLAKTWAGRLRPGQSRN